METAEYTLSAEEQRVIERTLALVADETREPLTTDERNGLRAFLQRGETRLSTYQRVAGVFLNGAGLLVLLPGLARESVYSTFSFALQNNTVSAKFLIAPWVLSTLIPLWAFALLLRDLIQFYFSPRFLESDPIRINRFALAGVTLPYDEGAEAKAQVIALKVSDHSYADFILGGTSQETVEKAHKESKAGKAAFPLRLAIMESLSSHVRNIELTSAEKIGVALSLAGSLDLSLVGEVARMESSLARHVLLLRKLVLRYSKALILFVWTTLLSIFVAGLLAFPGGLSVDVKTVSVLVAYAVWAEMSVRFIRFPLRWIDALVPLPDPSVQQSKQQTFRDPDLAEFERKVAIALRTGAGILLMLAAVAVYFWLYGAKGK